jgi:hypothetical protein
MKAEGRKFLIDANVLIAARRSYYGFDLCPGFWSSIKDGFGAKRIFSTRRVEVELLAGGDVLTTWIKHELPTGFFLDDSRAEVIAAYTPMMTWVAGRDFLPAAKAKFATDADGWLIATAKQEDHCLVTHETRQIGAKARVPMPNVCEEFGISYCNTFEMLRELECSYK